MGLFHCPLGAAYYDDEECIDCKMCLAQTEQEMVEASKKIRIYMKSHSTNRGPIKKIAVCGKGGVGKSTTVTLLANVLVKDGFDVLVMDTDESNPGLFRSFGFDIEPKPLIRLLSRFSNGQPDTNTEWIMRDNIAIQDIPAEYVIVRGGLKFIMVGKIDNPFQGCACSMADIVRDLMAKLILRDKEIVIIDMEAGVESFGRGVERNVDTVFMIVEPSFESMALAEKIGYMSEGMGIAHIGAILNKVPLENIKQRMVDELRKRKINILGVIYYDSQLAEAGFEGRALSYSKAEEDIRSIIKTLMGG